MKVKLTACLISGILFCTMLCGCVDQSNAESPESTKKSVVATSVTVCEILEALGVNTVVGVPETTTYTIPKCYEEAQNVGAAMNPDIEIIKTLNPDYVLSPKSLEGDLMTKYDNAGLDYYFMDLSGTQSMFESILEVGKLLGKEDAAKGMYAEFEEYMESYQKTNLTENAPRVLLLMGLPGSYVAATDASYAGSLVKLAGGENVYGEEEEAFINANPEDMLQKEPDIILLTSHALPEQVADMFEKEFEENDIWNHFTAVKEGEVYTLDHEKFGMSANFKYKEALDDLQGILYE